MKGERQLGCRRKKVQVAWYLGDGLLGVKGRKAVSWRALVSVKPEGGGRDGKVQGISYCHVGASMPAITLLHKNCCRDFLLLLWFCFCAGVLCFVLVCFFACLSGCLVVRLFGCLFVCLSVSLFMYVFLLYIGSGLVVSRRSEGTMGYYTTRAVPPPPLRGAGSSTASSGDTGQTMAGVK